VSTAILILLGIVLGVLGAAWWDLRRVITQAKEAIMAAIDDVNAVLSELDDATNEEAANVQGVSDRIDKILAELAAALANAAGGGGISKADVENLIVKLSSERDQAKATAARLTELAKDPENPVPPVEPAPV